MALSSSPALARLSLSDAARTYVEARAASMSGDHARAAQLLAALAQAQPDQSDIARKALSEAIGAGQMDLALGLARNVPATKLPVDARLLLATEQIRRRHPERALPWLAASGETGDLSFLTPLINAWAAADRGNEQQALAAFDQIPATSLLAPINAEERAFILLKFRRTAEAEPLARQAVGRAGARETRLRLAFADGFLAAGDRPRALMIVEGMGVGEAAARQRIAAGKLSGQGIDNLPEALSEVLMAFVGDLLRLQRGTPPIGLVQVARYANPQNSSATALLALLLAGQSRSNEALALLRSVSPSDALISQVRDVQTRILRDNKNFNEAYQVAASAAAAPNADVSDLSRLGEVLESMKRHNEAADAYGRAIAFAQAQKLDSQLWSLLLLRASALEEAKRWPEARASLQQALALAPDQPLLLNFLGYAKLERGEDVDAAEAMIRKASELAPDEGSITDSLGWAQFKRGKVGEAIVTLQHAAEKDPAEAEIQEHLGDALYRSGRRYEARYAWNASLVTAEDETAARVKAKLAGGLTPANAAP
ncbi:tetratricopeptide repeat protein [Sphingomonas sp.]|uniref:tetratricopeptide repeat protein n=1 Tax=Sphingomonas sp. TaxID=28214 RepID=UPI00389EAE2F